MSAAAANIGNASDWITRHAQSTPDRVALCDGDQTWSYSEFDAAVDRVVHGLGVAGVAPGAHVATVLPNSWALCVILVACVRHGCVAVPLNPMYRDEEIRSTFSDAKPDAVFAGPDAIERVDRIDGEIDHAPRLRCVFKGGDDLPEGAEAWASFDDLLNSPEPETDVARATLAPDAPALWLYSSGSTGGSKRISRTYAQLAAEAVGFHESTATTRDDVFLCAVPLSHAHGYGNGLTAAFFVGGTLVVHARFDRRAFLRAIEDHRVTIVPGSPFMFAVLAETKMDREPDLGSIRYLFSGGAPLARETYDAFLSRFGLPVRGLYGSTETGVVALNLAEDVGPTCTSVGRAIHATDIGAFDADGRRLRAGEEGALGIRTPAMFDAYARPELTAAAIRDGFFFPGDRGFVDADGFVTIVGRETTFINAGGNKIDPAEVERLIESHAHVKECVVLGAQQRGVEVVKAVIVASEAMEAADVIGHCRGRIADFKIPRLIEFRDEIPRNPLGKVLRKYLA